MIIIPQTSQHWEKLLRIVEVFTEVLSTSVRLSHFKSCIAFHGKQGRAQSDQRVHLSLETLRCLGERLEQREPLTEMSNSFDMGGALGSSLRRSMPIRDCFLCEPCLGIMMRQQFRLSFSRLWELGFKHQGYALMVLLPRAPQQGLIRRVLNQRVLKDIRCLGWQPSLVDNLCLDQPTQLML